MRSIQQTRSESRIKLMTWVITAHLAAQTRIRGIILLPLKNDICVGRFLNMLSASGLIREAFQKILDMNLLKNVKLEGERSGQVVEKCQIHLGLLLFF